MLISCKSYRTFNHHVQRSALPCMSIMQSSVAFSLSVRFVRRLQDLGKVLDYIVNQVKRESHF